MPLRVSPERTTYRPPVATVAVLAAPARRQTVSPASLGKNAGFLLLIGDDEENRAVERWARQCLGLPMSR